MTQSRNFELAGTQNSHHKTLSSSSKLSFTSIVDLNIFPGALEKADKVISATRNVIGRAKTPGKTPPPQSAHNNAHTASNSVLSTPFDANRDLLKTDFENTMQATTLLHSPESPNFKNTPQTRFFPEQPEAGTFGPLSGGSDTASLMQI